METPKRRWEIDGRLPPSVENVGRAKSDASEGVVMAYRRPAAAVPQRTVAIASSTFADGACQPTIAPCAAIIASVAALNSGK